MRETVAGKNSTRKNDETIQLYNFNRRGSSDFYKTELFMINQDNYDILSASV